MTSFFPCAQFPICLISDCDDVISSTNRDRLYYLDTELRLLRNLTWETDGSLLSMCTDTTVSSVLLWEYIHIWAIHYTLLCLYKERWGLFMCSAMFI